MGEVINQGIKSLHHPGCLQTFKDVFRRRPCAPSGYPHAVELVEDHLLWVIGKEPQGSETLFFNQNLWAMTW